MSSNLINNAIIKYNTTVQPKSSKVENEIPKKKHEFSTAEKVIGGLSALAILGTGIYFAVKRGKAPSGNKFKTIVKEDGSMERLFPNGNKVNIRTFQEKDGGWSRIITVIDSNGNKIAERGKGFSKHDDYTLLQTDTKKGFNSEGSPNTYAMKNISRYQDKVEFSNSEYYYNENGFGEENLIKNIRENKTTDKQGKLISENTSTEVRNKFGAFDKECHSIEYKKDGTITTSNKSDKYLDENLRNQKYNSKTVDANGNVLSVAKKDIFQDKNFNELKSSSQSESYKINADGKPIQTGMHLMNSEGPIGDYTSFYDKSYIPEIKTVDGVDREHFSIRNYKRDENGIGNLVEHCENLDGTIIENSHKQKSGPDVKYNTIIL